MYFTITNFGVFCLTKWRVKHGFPIVIYKCDLTDEGFFFGEKKI